MKYRLSAPAAAIMVVILIAPVAHAQDNLLLEVIVEDITALPGEHGVEIPIYMKNYSDSIAGFNLWLMLDRPDIMEFQMTFDTSGTLISGWEFVAVNSLGGMGHDINIVALANMSPPPQTPGIGYPQYGDRPLLKIFVDVYDIADTTTDRTVVLYIITVPAEHFCFSTPEGECIGISGGIVDTTKVNVSDGSLTVLVPICGDIDGSAAIPDVGDLMYLVQYLFGGGPPPPVPDMGDVDGSGGIDVADVTYLVSYLFQGGPAPVCT